MMKRAFLTICGLIFSVLVWSQNQDLALQANKPLSAAEKATIELSRVYDFTAEQALAVKKIQEAKFQNLASIEPLKAKSAKQYFNKKMNTLAIADNEMLTLLDARQQALFNQKQQEKEARYNQAVGGMRKQGYSEEAIQQKLMELEF